MDTTSREYAIPAWKIDGIRSTIEGLNKRARRLHCAPITLTIIRTETIADETTGDVRATTYVTVSGESPRINGWQLVAALSHENGATIIRSVPGAAAEGELAQYHGARQLCDHCHLVRARSETFILRNAGGELRQVGRQCIKDYLGHVNATALCEQAELLFTAMAACDSEEREYGSGSYAPDLIGSIHFLSLVSASIRQSGWVSRTAAQDRLTVSTSDIVLDSFTHARKCRGAACRSDELHITALDSDLQTAHSALEWARGLTDTRSDYLYNIHTLAQSDSFSVKNTGIVASIVSAYEREMGKRRENERVRDTSHHVGTVGKREAFSGLTVLYVSYLQGDYGVTCLYKLVDASGNRYVWRSSNDVLSQGETYTLVGTVKEHGEWQGVQETHLTRCKVQDVAA